VVRVGDVGFAIAVEITHYKRLGLLTDVVLGRRAEDTAALVHQHRQRVRGQVCGDEIGFAVPVEVTYGNRAWGDGAHWVVDRRVEVAAAVVQQHGHGPRRVVGRHDV